MALNLLEVRPGARLRLKDGQTLEVVSNPCDGVWIVGRYADSAEADDQMVCITDIAGLEE